MPGLLRAQRRQRSRVAAAPRRGRRQRHFVLNGQKTWTTYAQYADWIFVPRAHQLRRARSRPGISFLLVDMKTPGVTVKPFLTTGGTPAFCETWFENVEVPEGEPGRAAQRRLDLRQGAARSRAHAGRRRRHQPARARSGAQAHRRARRSGGGKPLLDDPGFRASIARLEIRARSAADGQLPRPRRRAARPRAGPRVEHPQAPRHGDPASMHRARHGAHGHELADLVQRAGRGAGRRAVGARRSSTTCAPRRSTAAPTRSRRTSSPSSSWACRAEDEGRGAWTSSSPKIRGCSSTPSRAS